MFGHTGIPGKEGRLLQNTEEEVLAFRPPVVEV